MADQEPEIVMTRPGVDAGPDIQQPGKLMRIASMVRLLLEEVRASPPDEAGRTRLREIYDRAVTALKETLSDELVHELETLTIPLDRTPSESEIRVAKAQLVGWLEGLFQGIQAALFAQQMQARAQLQEMARRRGLPPGAVEGTMEPRGPGQYL